MAEQTQTPEDRLRAFAQAVINSLQYDILDNEMAQDLALEHGLLELDVIQEPCGEFCECAATGDAFPVTCFVKTALLRGVAPSVGQE